MTITTRRSVLLRNVLALLMAKEHDQAIGEIARLIREEEDNAREITNRVITRSAS